MRRLTEEQILALLRNIESGGVTVSLDSIASAEAVAAENGVFHFDTSNKWRIGVFVDCGRFDFLDYIQHGGTKVDYGSLNRYYPDAVQYALKFRDPRLAKDLWGIEAKLYAPTNPKPEES